MYHVPMYGLRRYSYLGRDMLRPMIRADQSDSEHHTATATLRAFLSTEKATLKVNTGGFTYGF